MLLLLRDPPECGGATAADGVEELTDDDVTRESGTLGGVGGSGDKGDDPRPVNEDGGVIEAIDANICAGVVPLGGGVTLPPPPGVGLVIPLAGGLILFSFWRLLK